MHLAICSSPPSPSFILRIQILKNQNDPAMLLSKSLVILCSAAVATAQLLKYEAVATGALLLGDDISNPDATAYDVFNDPINHATAAATIFGYSTAVARFRPSGHWTNGRSYWEFKERVGSFRAFTLAHKKSKDLTFNGDYNLWDKLFEVYDKLSGVDKPETLKITNNLANVVGDHLENDNPLHWAFTTVVIRQLDGDVEIELVELGVKPNLPSESVNQWENDRAATLTVWKYLVNKDLLQKHAEQLAEKLNKITIKDFIGIFTTASPKGGLEAWLEVEQGHHTEQTSFTRRPRVLYPRM
ncbi:hypothetical protein BGZ72_007871 [Mortierella alpina]|nr:hypothetical protein BGZ72_007871 [Mortierella alpina]